MQDQLNFFIGEVRSALRYRWVGLAAAWAVCIGGWLYVAAMPDIYEAQARFFLDTSSLLAPVLEDQIIATNPEAQLTYIRESLLGQAELEAVARAVGLDDGITSALAYEAMLNGLRRNIVFEATNPVANQRGNDRIYDLIYRNSNRDKAIAVVEALLTSFIDGALGESQRDEDSALVFVNEQISTREEEIKRQERAISDFKRANADRLPGAQGDYLERLQQENEELAEARRDLRTVESRDSLQRQQIERMRQVIPSSPSGRPTNSLLDSIREVQREVDTLRLRLTEAHPVLIARIALLNDLKRQRADELRAQGIEGSDLELIEFEASPVYQDAVSALNETELAIAELRTEIAERETNVANLASLIDESLDNETALAELERNYQSNIDERLELVRSRQALILTLQASAAEQMNFRSINDPQASLAPVKPNRKLLLILVFAAALGAGCVLCYGLAQVRPVFSSGKALKEYAELPVLGIVTNAWPEAEKIAYRRSLLGFSAAIALLAFVFVGIVGIEVIGPGIHSPFGGQ